MSTTTGGISRCVGATPFSGSPVAIVSWNFRSAETVRPGGRSAVSVRVLARPVVAMRSPPYGSIAVVELAELRAAALRLLRLAPLVGRGDAKDRPVLGRRGLGAIEAVHGRHDRASC